MRKFPPVLLAFLLAWLPSTDALAAQTATITQTTFGQTPGGQAVTQYWLTNTQGMQVQILNLGGIIRVVRVPDRHHRFADVTLGFDSLAPYLTNAPYFGAVIGRYANRIARGEFSLDGKTYHLTINSPPSSLHGGKIGFSRVIWDGSPFTENGEVGVALHYTSPDGEEGYPGNLDVTVRYTLTNDNVIRIEYTATTDADTVLNLSNHPYWNLAGQGKGTILHQWMQINASSYTPTDATQIPTGEIRSVVGTPFDFLKPEPLGKRIRKKDPQLLIGQGYDHNWVLSKPQGSFGFAAQACDPLSGRVLTVFTDQPGLQLYTGNFLEGIPTGKGGALYRKFSGFSLETQHFPDSPNHPGFPTTELKAGQTFHSVTEYRFSVMRGWWVRPYGATTAPARPRYRHRRLHWRVWRVMPATAKTRVQSKPKLGSIAVVKPIPMVSKPAQAEVKPPSVRPVAAKAVATKAAVGKAVVRTPHPVRRIWRRRWYWRRWYWRRWRPAYRHAAPVKAAAAAAKPAVTTARAKSSPAPAHAAAITPKAAQTQHGATAVKSAAAKAVSANAALTKAMPSKAGIRKTHPVRRIWRRRWYRHRNRRLYLRKTPSAKPVAKHAAVKAAAPTSAKTTAKPAAGGSG